MKVLKMNTLPFLLLLLFLGFPPTLFSQQDTINILPFELIATPNKPAYKTTHLDSLSISRSENLAQLLTNNSTLFIKSYGGGSLATASFRGTGASHTKVQWNGINLNSPMNGQIDFSLYPTFFFDNAEIHYGASGLIDGNGALGGSVVMGNTADFSQGFSANINQTVGSFGSYTTAIKGKLAHNNWFLETKLYQNNSQNDFSFTNSTKINQPTAIQTNADLSQWGVQQAIYRKMKNSILGTRIWYFNSDRNLPSTLLTNQSNENQADQSFKGLIEWKGLAHNFEYHISSGIVNDNFIYQNKNSNIHAESTAYLWDNNINTILYLNNNFKIIDTLGNDTEKVHTFNKDWSKWLKKGKKVY